VSHAAVEMMSEMFDTLSGRRVLVVGAGAMGEGVAVALHRAGNVEIMVANRSADRGAALADRVEGVAVGFERLVDAVAAADIIVAGTGAGEPLLTVEVINAARANAVSPRPLHIVDIAVPRDVHPDVRVLPNVTVLDLADLRDWADRGLTHRTAEAVKAREIVAAEVERFAVESTARQAAPLVASLHELGERIRASELRRYESRLGELDDSQRRAVESLTRSIVAKLLHEPSVGLKSHAGTPQGERNASAVRDLFDLS
jgi:glutamyl-tRNA reductase